MASGAWKSFSPAVWCVWGMLWGAGEASGIASPPLRTWSRTKEAWWRWQPRGRCSQAWSRWLRPGLQAGMRALRQAVLTALWEVGLLSILTGGTLPLGKARGLARGDPAAGCLSGSTNPAFPFLPWSPAQHGELPHRSSCPGGPLWGVVGSGPPET